MIKVSIYKGFLINYNFCVLKNMVSEIERIFTDV